MQYANCTQIRSDLNSYYALQNVLEWLIVFVDGAHVHCTLYRDFYSRFFLVLQKVKDGDCHTNAYTFWKGVTWGHKCRFLRTDLRFSTLGISHLFSLPLEVMNLHLVSFWIFLSLCALVEIKHKISPGSVTQRWKAISIVLPKILWR